MIVMTMTAMVLHIDYFTALSLYGGAFLLDNIFTIIKHK